MNLKSKYENLNSYDLISIAEPNSDYTHEAKNIAIDIIRCRDENNEINITVEASSYWAVIISKNIKTIILNKQLPKSHFLDNDQMKDLVKDAFNNWKEKQELFGIDVTKYWAIF
jgi:hypothetical protein